jgi:hypothetical protein
MFVYENPFLLSPTLALEILAKMQAKFLSRLYNNRSIIDFQEPLSAIISSAHGKQHP